MLLKPENDRLIVLLFWLKFNLPSACRRFCGKYSGL